LEPILVNVTELLDHQSQVLDALSARVEFFGLLGRHLTLRIELCLEPPDLFVLNRDRVHPDPAMVRHPRTQCAITSRKCIRGKPASI
jgi:hypothetical protein